MKIEILEHRLYGQPKLNKPKHLKGIKQSGSIKFSKASCPAYITKDGVYIKHRDFFSQSISIPDALTANMIDKKKNKFIYNDNFGSVVLRNEAYLLVRGSLSGFKPEIVYRLIRETERALRLSEYALENYDWVHFYEQLYDLANS